MDLWKKARSSLDKHPETEISSSDEEMEKSVPMDEGRLFTLSDDQLGRLTAHNSCASFHRSTGADGYSKAEKNTVEVTEKGPTTDAEVEDGEIEYQNTPVGVLTLTSKKNESHNIDLDEICRQRNIHAPPKYRQQNRHRFQQDRQLAEEGKKLYNRNPRENVTLNDVIKSRLVGVGRGRDHQTIHRRHHYLGGNEPPTVQQRRNEKLKQAVKYMTECHPESAKAILEPSGQTPEEYPEFRDEPWQCISKLVNKGFSIGWSLMKLKNHESLNDEEESRLFRCLVGYNQVEGICEASNEMQAKQGAAVDLLGKLSKEFPNLGPFPEKVNEALLIKKSVWSTLKMKMQEENGGEFRFNFDTTSIEVNNHTLFRCILSMDTHIYEGSSFLNERAAKSLAIKMAYEDLLKEDCPMDVIHLGVDQCTRDQSLYRYVETHMVHCFDLSGSVVVDPQSVGAVGQVKKTRRPPCTRRDSIPVCYLKPKSGPRT